MNLKSVPAIECAEGHWKSVLRIDYRGVLKSVRTLIIISILIAIPAWPDSARAEEEEVFFQSDYQQEIQDEDVLLLQGNVEVHFRDVIIYADEVRLNDRKHEFFGVGNVRLVTTDRDIFSDSIWYDYQHDDFDMRNARGSLIVNGVSELVWFEAERLKGNIDDYKMINGRCSTCTPTERREYHIEARSIKVLPGNKVIFRSGYMFIFNTPILWFPYWSYSTAETPWTVQIGKDSFNGLYVKTRYNYLAEELIIGALILEYYSRKGWRIGADHSYVLPRHGNGSISWNFLYGTYRDNSTGEVSHANEYDLRLNQAIRFGSRFTGNFSFNTSSKYNLSRGRSNTTNATFNANYNTAGTRTSLNLTGRSATGATHSSSISVNLTHNRTIINNITTSGRVEYKVNKQTPGMAADEEFTAHFEFRQQREGWSWNAKVDTHWDPDVYTFLNDRGRGYTDRLPEINLTFQPTAFPAKWRNILGFQMQQLNLLGGLYYIGPVRDEINAFYGRFNTRFTRNHKFCPSHSNQSKHDLWQAISSTGDARYVYGTQVNWTWKLTTKLKWQLNWTRQDNEGRIPLTGLDRPGSPNNRLAWNLNYQNGRLYTIRLSTSYILRRAYGPARTNLWTIDRLQPMQLSVNYTPNRSTTITLSTQYNLAKGDLADIRSTVNITDDRSFRMQSNLTFEPPGTLKRFTTNTTFVIGEEWDGQVSFDFSPNVDDVIREIKLTHRLHCTYLAFQYRTQNDYWGVTWGVTGFPQAHLGYTTTDDSFGPDFFNSFSGSGSGFGAGGYNFGGSGGGYGGYGGYGGGYGGYN